MTTKAKMQHTPGPWQYSEVKHDHVVHGPEGDCICWCNGVRCNNEANANLICHAPEMLELLRQSLSTIIEELAAAGPDEVRSHPTLKRHSETAARIERLLYLIT